MSNIIPFVSSSPPPIGDQTFGWDDDEDDDFGNFASAPAFETSNTGDDNLKGGGFVADWPAMADTSGTSASGETETSSDNCGKNIEEDEHLSVDQSSTKCADVQDNGQEDGSDGADDDFADFAAFQGDPDRLDKPHIDSLPLKTTHQQRLDEDADSDMGIGKGTDTVMEKSRESTTDSGLFSTDMSPLPQSESLCISEGDKTMHSDDETFSDMPQDSQPQTLSHSDEGQGTTDPDQSRDEDSQSLCEDSQTSHDKEPSRQSDTTLSPDQTPDMSRVTEMTENEEAGEVDIEDNADGSLCQNDHSSSPSPAIDSVEVECHDPEELSSISDLENSITDMNEEPQDSSANDNGAIDVEIVEHLDMHTSVTQGSDEIPEHPQSAHECNEDDDKADDNDWAAFETSPSSLPQTENDANSPRDEPNDLVLRKDSIHFDDEEDLSGVSVGDDVISENEKSAKNSEEEEGEEGKTDSTMSKSFREEDNGQSQKDISEDLTNTHSFDGQDKGADGQLEQSVDADHPDESSNIPSVPSGDDQHMVPMRRGDDSGTEDDDGFEDFHGETIPENSTNDSENREDFAKFSAAGASQGNTGDDFGDFSSSRATDVGDDEDDFGDFNSGSGAADTNADKDDFGAFSNTTADAAGEDDDFGDFSGQPTASSDSGWADFAEPAKTSKSDDDFGNFSASDKPVQSDSFSNVNAATDHTGFPSSTSSSTSSSTQNVKINTLETSLKSCFPSPERAQQVCSSDQNDAKEDMDIGSGDKSQLGVLETILKYGLQFRSASRQTWQVVQHPSRKDPRVKLWGQLQDMDGSPAVIYQWGKSHTNSHLFHTLHIDTQNMLIGHKKRSVPIFATGLSLLEPIRGGKGREIGGSNQPDQGGISSMLSPTLVGSSSHETEQHVQDIPAVDFDWSTSGLTNPLTSHSLDLDFLVAQDSQTSDKPSVFQSELLDAPRSSVKSSQPLEDIMRSVKPTSVRSRRDEAATSQMSSEAVRVLASLPDLTFMQYKVLMFPIKN